MAFLGRAKFGKLAALMIAFLAGALVTYVYLEIDAFLELSKVIYERGIIHYSKSNQRGDRLSLTIDLNHPATTTAVVKLKRAHQGFATTLVTVSSSNLSYDLKWIDNDHAEVVFHVDNTGKMESPTAAVGPIHVVYSFNKDFK